MKKYNYTLALLFTCASTLLWVGCSKKETKTETETIAPTPQLDLSTAEIQQLNPVYEISIPGEVIPYEQVELFAKVTGFVKELRVERGDQVKKGQVLAILEAPEMNQRHLADRAIQDKANSDFQLAQQVYDRLVDASKTTGAVAQIELDRAKSNLESTKSTYNSAKASASQSSSIQQYLQITAPFDGLITAKFLSVGSLVGSGSNQPIYAIAQNNKLRLVTTLPEKHSSAVPENLAITFTTSSQPAQQFTATLSRTSGLLNSKDRSLTLEFDLDNSQKLWKGGDYAQLTLPLQRNTPSLWVKKSSIVNAQSGTFVLTLDRDQNIAKIPITKGIQLDTIVEVFGNLQAAEKVLLKPSEEIKEGKINN